MSKVKKMEVMGEPECVHCSREVVCKYRGAYIETSDAAEKLVRSLFEMDGVAGNFGFVVGCRHFYGWTQKSN